MLSCLLLAPLSLSVQAHYRNHVISHKCIMVALLEAQLSQSRSQRDVEHLCARLRVMVGLLQSLCVWDGLFCANLSLFLRSRRVQT